jgi:hypothetical protein
MSFARDFEKWRKKAELSIEQASRAVVLDASSRVGLRSPVDKGTYLANHNVSEGAPDFSVSETTTEDRQVVAKKAGQIISNPFGKFYISNGLPYAARIEFDNWSKKAMGGVYRLAAQDTKNNIRKIVSKAKK